MALRSFPEGVQVVGTFDTLGNDQNPETSQGRLLANFFD